MMVPKNAVERGYVELGKKVGEREGREELREGGGRKVVRGAK
jgi:hypothetical protein